MTIRQNVSMAVVHTYLNLTEEHILNFEEYFIHEVIGKNNSLNYTEEELEWYLENGNSQEDGN